MKITSILAAAVLSLGLATSAVAAGHHGHHGFGGYGFPGLFPAFGGASVCVEPTTGQPVLCPVLSPFFGNPYGLGAWGYGGGYRGHHRH